MVSSVSSSTSAINTLLQTQSTGVSSGIAALRSSQKAQQAIIDQLQQTATDLKVATQSNAAPASSGGASGNSSNTSLPRGSLVDLLV